MALVGIKNSFLYPGLAYSNTSIPSVGGPATLDAAGEYSSWVGQAVEDMVISHVGVGYSSPTGAPTAKISIQTIGTDGLLSADWNTTEMTTGSLGAASAFAVFALTNSATITKGQFFGVKVMYNSGTSFSTRMTGGAGLWTGPPYQIVNTGTPTKGRLTSAHQLIVGSSSTVFYCLPGMTSLYTIKATPTFNNTAGLIRGVHFSLPFDARISGIVVNQNTEIGNIDIAVRDSAGTIVGNTNTSIDGDYNPVGGNTRRLFFDTAATLDAGTFYKVTIEPTSATNTHMDCGQVTSADYKTALPAGANWYYTDNNGGWNTVTTDIPMIDLIFDQISDGASAGGLLTHSGLTGGIRG